LLLSAALAIILRRGGGLKSDYDNDDTMTIKEYDFYLKDKAKKAKQNTKGK
jgi:hypothetical protein